MKTRSKTTRTQSKQSLFSIDEDLRLSCFLFKMDPKGKSVALLACLSSTWIGINNLRLSWLLFNIDPQASI